MRVIIKIDDDLDKDSPEFKTYGKRKCISAIKGSIYEMLSVLDLDMAIDNLESWENK